MTRSRAAAILLLALAAGAGCRAERRSPGTGTEPPRDQPPVALDPVPPVEYPPALFTQGVAGRVVLRLFVDASGAIVPDSTRVEESSGVPALDTAALAAALNIRFAPALRDGEPVPASFLQPFDFRPPVDPAAANGVAP
jgi:protein TonB